MVLGYAPRIRPGDRITAEKLTVNRRVLDTSNSTEFRRLGNVTTIIIIIMRDPVGRTSGVRTQCRKKRTQDLIASSPIRSYSYKNNNNTRVAAVGGLHVHALSAAARVFCIRVYVLVHFSEVFTKIQRLRLCVTTATVVLIDR